MPNEATPVNEKLTSAHSIEMLKAVIDGNTYDRVAARFGVTRTAVERRVKSTIRQLIDRVGIEGMVTQHAGYVHRIRQHRDAILLALAHFEPAAPFGPRPVGRVLDEQELLLALKRIASRSSWPSRDQALFYILFITGARPLEIARLQVSDYLSPDGSVRVQSEIRAQVAITGKSRPLYFTSAKLDELMDAYLLQRLQTKPAPDVMSQDPIELLSKSDADSETSQIKGTLEKSIQDDVSAGYRRLDPNSPLFVTSHGEGFRIFEYGQGGQRRYLCRPILELYRKIFRQAELTGLSPLAVRQTVAARLYERGADEEQVGLLLGLSDRASVKDQFPRPKRCIQDLVRD